MNQPTVEALVNEHCRTGENPLWDTRRESLFWTDIPAGKIYSYDPAAGSHAQVYSGPVVGGFTLQENGDLLLFREKDIARFCPDSGEGSSLLPFDDPGAMRFNDVIADPAGRVYAGTMSKEPGKAGLYRLDPDGTLCLLFRGATIANGLGFTADLHTLFWTDSAAREIYRFAYDSKDGGLGEREVFYSPGEEPGLPDGLAVDADDHVWSAHWDGWGIVQIGADGVPLRKIDLPVAKVSSACFGGSDLGDLYVTTAGGDPAADTADGTLYRIRGGVRGRPEFRSKILV